MEPNKPVSCQESALPTLDVLGSEEQLFRRRGDADLIAGLHRMDTIERNATGLS
jgi:hypothetical protein